MYELVEIRLYLVFKQISEALMVDLLLLIAQATLSLYLGLLGWPDQMIAQVPKPGPDYLNKWI
jgi:hypothetical protein